MKKTSLFSLFIAFFKVGVLTFGGGLSMLPLLKKECIEKNKWLEEDELLNYIAIGQCTPGIIAVNVATFVGFKERGILGGIFATLGVVMPSFIIMILLGGLLNKYYSNEYVIKAFRGIRIAVCGLIFGVLFKLCLSNLKTISSITIAVLGFLLELIFGVSPVYIIIIAIVWGVMTYIISKKRGKE